MIKARLASALIDQVVEDLIQVGPLKARRIVTDLQEIGGEMRQQIGMDRLIVFGVGVGQFSDRDGKGHGEGLLDQHRGGRGAQRNDHMVLPLKAFDLHRGAGLGVAFTRNGHVHRSGAVNTLCAGFDLIGEDAAFIDFARHAAIDDRDAGAAVAVLPEELDIGWRQPEIGHIQPAVGARDLNREVEALAQIDAGREDVT